MHKTFLLCVVAPAASQDLQDLHSNPAATALLRAPRRPSLPAGREVGAESRERSSPAQHHLFIQRCLSLGSTGLLISEAGESLHTPASKGSSGTLGSSHLWLFCSQLWMRARREGECVI